MCVCVFLVFLMFNAVGLLAASDPSSSPFHCNFPTINWPTVSGSLSSFQYKALGRLYPRPLPDANLSSPVPGLGLCVFQLDFFGHNLFLYLQLSCFKSLNLLLISLTCFKILNL